MKKQTLCERAAVESCRLWKWNWYSMPTSPADIQATIAHAWKDGYLSRQRDEKKKVKRA